MSRKIDLLQNHPRRGSVVLFVTRAGKVRLGEVLADPVVGHEEFSLQDTGGARNRVKLRDLLLNLGPSADGLAAMQQKIENIVKQLDLELLLEAHPEWQNGPAIPVRAIAEEYFGAETDTRQHAAAYLALQRDSRFTLSGEKVTYRPPSPAIKRQHSAEERQELFTALCATMTESLQKKWGEAELNAHPLGKKLIRLARATLEQRRPYPEIWRKQFVIHLHSLHTLTGYRDARHLIFSWLKKIGRVSADADIFVFSEPLVRRHSRRLGSYQNMAATGPEAIALTSAALLSADFENIQRECLIPPELVVTIDNPETTDRDDALSYRHTENGIEIGVHTPLLEVLVPKETLFDQWAYDVGASAYMPHRTVPMLPKNISSALASLNAGCERPVLSFYFIVNGDQSPRLSRVVCERIDIGLNTDYEHVDAWLSAIASGGSINDRLNSSDSGEIGKDNLPPHFIEALQEWTKEAGRLEKQRLANGAKIFDRDEIEVKVGADGIVHLRRISRDSVAHKMVAEWMIAANQAAAQFCHEHHLPCIYRVQETLVPEREDEESSSGRGRMRAQLKPERAPHRDLGVDGYTQISSPLRRYGDLVMQRQIVSFLQTGKPCYSQTDLWARALSIEEATRRIQRLEARADFYWKCVYLSQHPDETYTARIGRSSGPNPRIILQILDLDLRLHVPPSGIEGIAERKIPPHHSPMEVQVVCLEMEAEKAVMRFQIR